MNQSIRKILFWIVSAVAVGTMVWWIQKRPSYLIYQAQSQIGKENEAAAIAEYRRALNRRALPKEEEIKLRQGLVELYARIVDNEGPSSVSFSDQYHYLDPITGSAREGSVRGKEAAEHPYVAEAKAECEKILALDDHNAVAHMYLGWIYLVRHLNRFAKEEFEKSRADDPTHPGPLIFLSRLNLYENKPAEAREAALQALVLSGNNDEARFALISAYEQLGNRSAALDAYEELSEAYRSRPEVQATYAQMLGREAFWEKADEQMSQAVARAPKSAFVQFQLGEYFLQKGMADKAAAAFEQSHRLHPNDFWSVAYQAYALSKLGECDQIERVRQLLYDYYEGASVRSPWVSLMSAQADLCAGRDTPALQSLDAALELDGTNELALELKARLLLDKGAFSALGDFVRPLLDKKDHESDGDLLLAESFFRQGDAVMARSSAESCLSKDPRNARAFVWQGLSLLRQKNGREGMFALDRARVLNPYDGSIAATLALAQAESGNTVKAETLLAEVLQLWPHDANALEIAGEAYLALRRPTEAARCFQNAAQLKPYLYAAQLGLARCYDALHDAPSKQAALSRAFEINPKRQGKFFFLSGS